MIFLSGGKIFLDRGNQGVLEGCSLFTNLS